jgi:hypothetical protein
MTDFLRQLVDRARGQAVLLQPRLPSLFEPSYVELPALVAEGPNLHEAPPQTGHPPEPGPASRRRPLYAELPALVAEEPDLHGAPPQTGRPPEPGPASRSRPSYDAASTGRPNDSRTDTSPDPKPHVHVVRERTGEPIPERPPQGEDSRPVARLAAPRPADPPAHRDDPRQPVRSVWASRDKPYDSAGAQPAAGPPETDARLVVVQRRVDHRENEPRAFVPAPTAPEPEHRPLPDLERRPEPRQREVPRGGIVPVVSARRETPVEPAAEPVPTPAVHVSIGRVEVRAVKPEPLPARTRRPTRAMNLDEYLADRNGRSRP